MSKPNTNNKLPAKAHFLIAVVNKLYISTITVVLLCFCKYPVTSVQTTHKAHNEQGFPCRHFRKPWLINALSYEMFRCVCL
jgi:hypothetical protein